MDFRQRKPQRFKMDMSAAEVRRAAIADGKAQPSSPLHHTHGPTGVAPEVFHPFGLKAANEDLGAVGVSGV